MKHTIGPWTINTTGFAEPILIKSENAPAGYQGIAEVCLFGDETDKAERERMANAHLIAAAPELLEATKTFLATIKVIEKTLLPYIKTLSYNETSDLFGLRRIEAELQRLITKAEGKKK